MFKHVLKHVVVDSLKKHEQQHVLNMDARDEKNHGDLEQALIAAFVAEGVEAEPAAEAAAKYLRVFGPERCQAHLPHFAGHCEAARAGPKGLRSPVGLFVASIRENWGPPAEQKRTTWWDGYDDLVER